MVEYELRPTFEAKFDGMDRREFEIVERLIGEIDESVIGDVVIKGLKATIHFEDYGDYEIFSNGMIVKERERTTVTRINNGASIETTTYTKEMYESITYFDNSPDELDCIYYDILDLLGG